MLIAHISDLHIRPNGKKLYDFIDVNSINAQLIHHLNNLTERPDFIVITGDITNCGLAEEYLVAQRLLGYLNYPVYLVPGNHDNKQLFVDYLQPICPEIGNDPENIFYVIEHQDKRLYFIDSSLHGKPYGYITDATQKWLENALQTTEKESFLFLHHPPIHFGNIQMDNIACQNGNVILRLISQFPHLTRIFCGHVHRIMFVQYQQAIIASVSGTTHQVPYHSSDTTDRYSLEKGPMLMHRYLENQGLVSYALHTESYQPSYLYDPKISYA